MFCFHDNADAVWFQTLHQSVSDLDRGLFLNLQSPGENIDNARDFRKAYYLAVRYVRYVSPDDEREEVSLAHRIKVDVLDWYNLARFVSGDRTVCDHNQLLPVSV